MSDDSWFLLASLQLQKPLIFVSHLLLLTKSFLEYMRLVLAPRVFFKYMYMGGIRADKR